MLWETQVVLSEPGRAAVLAQLHEGHPPGMSSMKGLARMYGGLESLEILNVLFVIVQSVSVINLNQL